MGVIYKDIECKSALNKLKRKNPYGWDLNVYRGCEHGCRYCFAIYTHEYMTSKDYFGEIHIKRNILDELEKQLRSPRWKREVINIGGVTDSYQPIEKENKIMPEILKLLIKYKTPAIISTKSDLILRDYDLIDELSNLTYINVAATVTTMDEKIRSVMEPNAVDSIKRFEMLNQFSKTNASIGLHIIPIIPLITDSFENLNEIFYRGKESGVSYVLPGTLYLRGETRIVFFDYMRAAFPKIYSDLNKIYKIDKPNKEYKDKLYKMIDELKDKYSISSNYKTVMDEKMNQYLGEQITFF